VRRVVTHLVALTLSVLVVGWVMATEAVCEAELRAALPPAGAPDGVVAVELLAAAVRLADPALGRFGNPGTPIPDGERGAEAARFLSGLGLLPRGWSVANHDLDAWRWMLDRFASWYRAAPVAVERGGREAMLSAAAGTLANVSQMLRPLAVFGTDASDAVTFFVLVINWTPQPRLVVLPVPDGLRLGEGRGDARAEAVLAAMAGCALRFESFAYAREDVALRLFAQQGESSFRVFGVDPVGAAVPELFEPERVLDVFRFSDPSLAGVRALSGGVEGPSITLGTGLQLLLVLRTNIGLDGIFFHTAFP